MEVHNDQGFATPFSGQKDHLTTSVCWACLPTMRNDVHITRSVFPFLSSPLLTFQNKLQRFRASCCVMPSTKSISCTGEALLSNLQANWPLVAVFVCFSGFPPRAFISRLGIRGLESGLGQSKLPTSYPIQLQKSVPVFLDTQNDFLALSRKPA